MTSMTVVSITRLRVRAWRFLPPFFLRTMRSAWQASHADGSLGVKLLRDRDRAFWTATSWSSEAALKTFMLAPPHGPTMRKLLNWCDEASLVRWTQAHQELPPWDEAHARLVREGRPSKVNHPSAAHEALRFALPVVSRTRELILK